MTPSHMEPCQTTRHGRDVSSVGGLGRVVRPSTSNQALSQRGTPSLSLSVILLTAAESVREAAHWEQRSEVKR